MEREGLEAKCVTLKLKDKEFNLTTRAKTLPHYIASADDLFEAAHALLLPQLPISLRLMGVRASAFRPKPAKDQATLHAFLAKGDAAGAAAAPASFPPLPPSAPPKRKETAAGRAAGGGIEAGLGKRSSGSGSSSSGNDVARDEAGTEVVVVIDDDDDNGEESFAALSAQAPPTTSSYACPICGSVRAGDTLAAFNQHVDSCLARTDPHFDASRKREQQQQLQQGEQEGGKSSKKKRAAGPLDAFLKKQSK